MSTIYIVYFLRYSNKLIAKIFLVLWLYGFTRHVCFHQQVHFKYVTGFAKTVPNGTLIKLQYKSLKKPVKLVYFTSCL